MRLSEFDFATTFKILGLAVLLAAAAAVLFLPLSLGAKLLGCFAFKASSLVHSVAAAPSARAIVVSPNGVQQALPENASLRGGLAPNGLYEVRVFKDMELEESGQSYRYGLVSVPGRRLLGYLEAGGGYLDFARAKSETQVLWHPTSSCFALTDRSTRLTRDLFLYSVANGVPDKLDFDFGSCVSNAMGRIGAAGQPRLRLFDALDWDDSALDCLLTFSADGENVYAVPFKLALAEWSVSGQDRYPSRVAFQSMGDPELDED